MLTDTATTVPSPSDEDHNYIEYRTNAVKAFEHFEANSDDPAICTNVAIGWAILALAEAIKVY